MLTAVKKLLPGHWLKLKVTPSGLHQTTGRWYTPPTTPLKVLNSLKIPVYNPHKTPQLLLKELDNIVSEQCVADVPLGAFLSGGVDSSAVVASMVATGHTPKHCYCIGFSGEDMTGEGFSDDLTHARKVADFLGVPLTEVRVGPAEILSELKGLAWLLDEPQADPAPLLVRKIAEKARKDGIKVLMSGTGGDDVMTGYRRHLAARIRQKTGLFGPLLAAPLHLLSRYLKSPLGRRAGRLASLLGGSTDDFLLNAFTTNGLGDGRTLLNPQTRCQVGEWSNHLTQARTESAGQDLVNRMLYMELAGFLPDHNLNYSDKASMAAGVEVRVPLIDNRLLAWMADVDPKKKLHKTRLKAFFKDAVSPRLPLKTINRSKAGFGAPVRSWLTGPGPGKVLVEETLFSTPSQLDNLLDKTAVKSLWQETLSGQTDGAYTILALCMAHWWLQGLQQARAQ
jgi:asparagine synthase (glutamine-hydrolysing)